MEPVPPLRFPLSFLHCLLNMSEHSEDHILEINNLVVRFRSDSGYLRAVDDISYQLKRGQTIGIVGESGSGKSVSSLSIMGLVPDPPGEVSQGEILFDSPTQGKVDLLKLSRSEMRHFRGNEISMIFQEPMTSLNPVFTCGFQVMEAIQLHQKVNKSEAYDKTIELFNKVQLPRPEAIFNSYPHQISGGQKQRVMIAMALSCNPSILIADEPTTALDVTVQKTILDLMRNLRDEYGMSIIFITHDLGVVAEIADYVLVMYQGKIVERGHVLDIFREPKHPYTKGLLACRPRMDIRLRTLPTITDFMVEDEQGRFQERTETVTSILEDATVSAEEYKERQAELTSRTPLLQVKDLKTWFPLRKGLLGRVTGHVKAVDGVTFDVYPGETLGLVGESGCGKTTLGRSILRLQEPSSGQVLYEGKDLAQMTEKELRRMRKDIQIIFQDPYSSLNPRMTIGNAILEPMKVHGLYDNDRQRKEKVYDLLSKVNLLPNHYNRYPHEFSGGQRQRVCIARALALNPKFIICDESVSALDVSVQAQVLNLLLDLRREFNLTYIFISHDLSVVKFMSDRMIVMNDGLIEEMGFADEIYADPGREYTRTLIEAIPKGSLSDIEERFAPKA